MFVIKLVKIYICVILLKPLVNTIAMSFGFFPNKGLSNLKPEISDVWFIFSCSYLSSLSFFCREIAIINRILHTTTYNVNRTK